ncbi:MAG: glycosyltransferase family 4 protein [Candidatus Moranbacteria bacterium]|nr:glycosyltransferase family 4 protein [Candidatus Moranbacteria bacterium]
MKKIIVLIKKAYRELRIYGIRHVISGIRFYLQNKLFIKSFSFDYEFDRWKKYHNRQSNAASRTVPEKDASDIKKQKIAFLIPGTHISGGVGMVLQHANRLLRKGYDVEVFSLSNSDSIDWFPNQKVKIVPYRIAEGVMRSGSVDILIATNWSTVFTVDMSSARRKCYYVQSDESRFFSEDMVLTEKINVGYAIDFEYFTAARWMQYWLKDAYGHDATYVPNGIDLDIFKKVGPIVQKTGKPRVLIEGSINISYKGMDDAYDAIKDLDCEIWIVSNNGKPRSHWRYDRFFENVPFEKMHELYSSCDIFLKMSRIEGFFGPPMEAMACGCAVVVGKVSGYDEYVVDGKNALVVDMGDVDAAKKSVEKLIRDAELREKLIAGGYETIKDWSWERSSHLMEKFLEPIL